MTIDITKQCAYPGCFRYPKSAIHGGTSGCKRCFEDGGHTHWNFYLSVNRDKSLLNHHLFTRLSWPEPAAPVLPPMEGITYYE